MAELADALDLGSSEATRTGSIPATRTKNVRLRQYNILNEYWPKLSLFVCFDIDISSN